MRPWQVCVARPRVLSASCGSPPAASLPPRSPWARWLQSCLLAAFRGAFSSPGLLRPSIPEGRFFLLLQPTRPPTVPCLDSCHHPSGTCRLALPPSSARLGASPDSPVAGELFERALLSAVPLSPHPPVPSSAQHSVLTLSDDTPSFAEARIKPLSYFQSFRWVFIP